MSDVGFPDPEKASPAAPPEPVGRSASVRLREVEDRRSGQLMDPANQSLAEALRITYRIVQGAMIVLAALFIFSGVQRVEEGQSGIPLLFGRPTSTGELPPGLHFSAPFPMGEIVKVDAGTTKLGIMTEYWPKVAKGQEDLAIDKLTSLPQIAPGRDGSLVTADLNLAHAQWKVEYRRTNRREYAENILPEDEQEIVSAAVERGIVRAVAEEPIDGLLKQTESDVNSVASQVMNIAQSSLNRIHSGIQIDKVTLYRVTAPIKLRPQFEKVLAATSEASTLGQKAGGERDATLNRVAGAAAPQLISLIQDYESALELGEDEHAERILAAINDVFEGKAVEIDGKKIPARLASGEVTEIISQARTKAISLRETAEAELRIFNAKREQFRANPRLMMFRDWVSAYNAFTSKAYVQTEILPKGTTWQMILSADPDIEKDIYMDINRRKTLESEQKHREQIEKQRYEMQNNEVSG